MTLTFGKRKFFVGINSKTYSFFFARLQSLRSNVYAYGTMLNFIKFVLHSRGKQQHDGENKVLLSRGMYGNIKSKLRNTSLATNISQCGSLNSKMFAEKFNSISIADNI